MKSRIVVPMTIVMIILALAAIACNPAPAGSPVGDGPDSPSTPGSGDTSAQSVPQDRDMTSVPAPIERVQINIAESFPPQYFVIVTSGLPNGCVKFDEYKVRRLGKTINIDVTNLEPADTDVVCTQVYGTVDSNIALGSEFEPGETYTVHVNSVTETFVAQGSKAEPGSPPSTEVEASLREPFRIEVGQVAVIDSGNVEFQLLEVMEDSRCPANVTCIDAGRARVLVGFLAVGSGQLRAELVLRAGQPELAVINLDRFTAQLISLDPYPGTPEAVAQGNEPKYVATVAVMADDDAPPIKPFPDRVAIEAPIESVMIIVNDPSTQAGVLTVVSGLPNACHQFEEINVTRHGNVIDLTVLNTIPTNKNLACAEIYGIVENQVAIEGDVQACELFQIIANGVSQQASAISPNVKCANLTSVLAPIESVEVRITNRIPPETSLRVVSGLPNGCATFERYEIDRAGEAINVAVTNTVPADPNALCTLDYRTHESIIDLGTDFRNGVTYTVNVNDVTETFVGFSLDDFMLPDMVEVLAPIQSVDLVIGESAPPQYSVVVISTRPAGSSCSEFDGYDVDRRGNDIFVTVTNLEAIGSLVPCTRDLPIDRTEIPLGSDFTSGDTYRVFVNTDLWVTFEAQS